MKLDVISDCEGSFATVREAFPGVEDEEPWWIPVNVALLRAGDDWAYFMSGDSLEQRPHLREKLLHADVERVSGETEIASGVTVFPTPGHTPGHMSVRAGSSAVLGDMVAHELQLADPELVFVNDVDPDEAAVTRGRVLAELAHDGLEVTAGHFSRVGRIERAGKGFRWAVE